MTPTRTALAALLHAALLTSSFLLLPSSAQAEVIPIIITNIVVQKIGPEAELEPLEEGLLYWRPADATTEAGLYYADGETPGGVAVCVGKADYHTLTNDLACNGHALKLNAHYSLRAEGDSCLLRYGTNIVLRVDGNREAGSTNSLIKATILSADNEGLTIQANALASDGATIEVTTDLMAVEAWTTATNAVVTDTTDVSTTWRITYLDEPYQFYRVFAGASTPHGTGITAELPFTASQGLAIPEGQGLTLGTNTWTNLPDMSTYASNSAVAAVRADLTSLSWRTTTAEGAIDANAAGIAAVQGAVATNAGNIATNSNRLSAIEADYVKAADLADFATTGAVEAVEERVEKLELPDTCTLYWTDNTLLNGGTNAIPTNFPTSKLKVWIFDNYSTNVTIDVPAGWNPGREVEIELLLPNSSYRSADKPVIFHWCGSTMATRTTTAGYRLWGRWDPNSGLWTTFNQQPNTSTYTVTPDGTRNIGPANLSAWAPATVEQWEALRTSPPSLLSTPSLQSLRPSLSSSAPLALGADLDVPDAIATFDPAAFDPDDFTDDPTALDDLAPEDFPEDLDDFADAPDDAPPAEE